MGYVSLQSDYDQLLEHARLFSSDYEDAINAIGETFKYCRYAPCGYLSEAVGPVAQQCVYSWTVCLSFVEVLVVVLTRFFGIISGAGSVCLAMSSKFKNICGGGFDDLTGAIGGMGGPGIMSGLGGLGGCCSCGTPILGMVAPILGIFAPVAAAVASVGGIGACAPLLLLAIPFIPILLLMLLIQMESLL